MSPEVGRPHETETRNSRLRQLIRGPIEAVTAFVHRQFPELTANHISIAGAVGVAFGSYLALKYNNKRSEDRTVLSAMVPFAVLAASSALDAFDGPMARLCNKENPTDPDLKYGQLVDVIADRVQEAQIATSRAMQAHHRRDSVGEFLACLSGISNVFPSLSRANAESEGIIVAEGGNSLIKFFGTRAGRALTGIISTVLPEIEGIPVQVILDAANVAANTATTFERISRLRNAGDEERILSEEDRENAKLRASSLKALRLATFGIMLGTYAALRVNPNRSG